MEYRNDQLSQTASGRSKRYPLSSILYPRSSRPRAFSFAEVMFAVVILGIGFIMIAAIFPVAIQQTQSNGEENVAALAARDAADAITSLPGSVLASGGVSYPTFPPTVKNYIIGSQDGSLPGVVPPPAVVVPFNGARWQLLQSNSIQISDQRYAYVPFYRRENGTSSAELIVIAVAVRNGPTYVTGDALNKNNTANVSVTLTPNGMMGPPPVATANIGKTANLPTTIYPDTLTFAAGAPQGEWANLSVQMSTASSLIGRSYTCGRQISGGIFELNPADGIATGAGYDGNWGTPNRSVDSNVTTPPLPVNGTLLNRATLQPQVAYAAFSATPANPAGEVTLYTSDSANGAVVPAVAAPGAFVIVADDFPYDSNVSSTATAGTYSYALVPNLPNPPSGIPPYAVGAMNGRIFRLSSVATDVSRFNKLKRFNLDPAFGMRPQGGYVESPDTMPGQSIVTAAGSNGTWYDPANGENFRVKVYIVGANTAGGTAQDIGVFATYFPVKN